MSEKNLKSLRFHGLDDIYKIPSTAEDVGATPVSHLNNSDNPHNVTASQIGAAVPSDVTNAKTMAINESKTYTDSQVRKAAPRNLLDNSDFRNPINQRGLPSYNGACYTIDRWCGLNDQSSVELFNGYVQLGNTATDGTAMAFYAQYIEVPDTLIGKKVTACLTLKGGWKNIMVAQIGANTSSAVHNAAGNHIGFLRVDWEDSRKCVSVRPIVNANCAIDIEHISLYEGEYTIDTLPEYQPKGYGAELAECQRYTVLIPHTVEGFVIGYGVASTDTVAYITVDLPETVQEYTNVMPTIMGTFQLRGNGDIIDVDSVVCYSVNGHKLVLECRVNSGLASMQFYVLRALENILISKEL